MLKAKLPAHARFWNAGGTFADRAGPLRRARSAESAQLVADERHVWLES